MNQTASAMAPKGTGLAWYALIASDLAQVENVLSQSLKSDHSRVMEVINHVSHYRGKRLRPALLLLTARACGGSGRAHHVLGAVVEMIHTATLVHDDVLDNAIVRRHVQTVNTIWGAQASILLGDHLFTRAFHLASTLGDARACEMIGEATNRVCEGELRQDLEIGNLDLTEKEYIEVIEGKTAELIACCGQLGAFYSNADEETVERMARYGRWLGIAFQIADDLLDLIGEEDAAGKSLGTDLQQQKPTLPLIHVLQNGSPAQKARARQLLTSDRIDKSALLSLLNESGSLEYARAVALEHAARARNELNILPPSLARTALESLTEQVVDRDC